MGTSTPSQHVIQAIARKEGISVTELSPPLYDAIDTEALDALLSGDSTPDDGSLEISFEYRGYHVNVEDGSTPEVSLRTTPGGSSDSRGASGRTGTPD